MRTATGRLSFSVLWLLPAAHVAAQSQCDCTAIVDSCRADVAIQGAWLEVNSDHEQCSRVDYFVDGLPFVTLVVDGVQRQNWVTRAATPQILVQSCQVCRENAAPALERTPAPAIGERENAELAPLIEVAPQYPAAAQAQGIEGYVEVTFTVDPLGNVADASVTSSEPRGVFDQAALAAIGRWRYPADPERAPTSLSRRQDFTLTATRPQGSGSGAPRVANGPRNQCLREQTVYNYGEMIEVDLINACTAPLLVYSCASGTGGELGRWVCADAERSRRLLAPVGALRSGTTTTVDTSVGSRDFTFIGSAIVTRAPNTQYWWLACEAADPACRSDAREWVRSLDRQIASIDPQSRTARTVARSY